MRSILLFFCLTCSIAVIGQLPEGSYICLFPTDEHAAEIQLRPGNRFTYRQSYHASGRHGSGRYAISNNKLIFQFENPDSLLIQPVTRTSTAKGDSVIIELHLYNPIDTTALPGVTVRDKNGKTGTVSDMMGNAKLKFASPKLPVEVEISYIGARTAKMTISEKGIYSINYPMPFYYNEIEYGKRMEFLFKTNDKGHLLLKEKGQKHYLTYERKNN